MPEAGITLIEYLVKGRGQRPSTLDPSLQTVPQQ